MSVHVGRPISTKELVYSRTATDSNAGFVNATHKDYQLAFYDSSRELVKGLKCDFYFLWVSTMSTSISNRSTADSLGSGVRVGVLVAQANSVRGLVEQ